MKLSKRIAVCLTTMGAVALAAAVALPARAAQIDTDARTAIPENVQQLIVVDYRAMENSPTAMNLKARLLPPQLKDLETALSHSGMNVGDDVEVLAFAAYRTGTGNDDNVDVVGVAQGQFEVQDIVAGFTKKKMKPIMIRNNRLWPMGSSGMLVTFLNPTTMLFGSKDALKPALDARDGLAPNMLSNSNLVSAMGQVDSQPLWSIMDQEGTQYMMRSLLGQASQLANFDTLKTRLQSSSYTMNFNNGVNFTLNVNTSDTFTAATMSSLLNAAALFEKTSGTAVEKQAIDSTTINSTASVLTVTFATSDNQFESLLQSPLFADVVR
ncbi:MAG: hypothetical protein WCC14_02550 [Acidobacteriaceae bacterium]